jgi:hypothetical protein
MKGVKRSGLLFFGVALWFIACDKVTENPEHSHGLRVAVGACMNRELAKSSADSALMGTVAFQSRDSIRLALQVELNCEATYAFEAVYRPPDTLAFSARDVGDTRAKCMCSKEVAFEFRAFHGEDLALVKYVQWDSRVFELIQPAKIP